MKEMPERIYLFDCNETMTTPLEGDTEYIRKDAFIEKACEWLEKNARNYASTAAYSTVLNYYEELLIEDFKRYINNIDNINNKQNAK